MVRTGSGEDQVAWWLMYRDTPTREQAIAESARNLRLQLVIERRLRSGRSRSYATGMNPNPRLWKYHWFVFVSPPDYDGSAKCWTYAMPAMSAHGGLLTRLRPRETMEACPSR